MWIKWFQIGSASLGGHGSVGIDQMRHGLGSSTSAMQNCSPSVVKQPSRPRMPPPSRVATEFLCYQFYFYFLLICCWVPFDRWSW